MTTNSVTTNAETIVRRAYHLAEGNVMDVRGFIDLFADDGVINAGLNSYRGKDLDYIVVFMGKLAPDVHRELHRVHVMDDVIALELSIRGLHRGIRVASWRHPWEWSQARRPGRRLLVCGRRQNQGVQLPCRCQHHACTNGHTDRLRIRGQSDGREMMQTFNDARLLRICAPFVGPG
jgi:hypothetical protein